MAALIPTGTAEAVSADFTLAEGQSTTLFLMNDDGSPVTPAARAFIQIQSGTQYFKVGQLTGMGSSAVLTAIGTFRVFKFASTVPFGVDRN
jgi:hypothetical protein